ncbi:MAG: 30S ribosomal protein S6 [Chlamydiae bacterium]|nr:30S ribosomal protein S6 [Chlamydiota bacterium]
MKEETKQLYEGMYILNATLSSDARKKALERITKGITESGGEVHKSHDEGKRKLAYEIRGSREGHYYVLYFTATQSKLAGLWEEYHLNEDLLRFMTLKADKVRETLEFKQLPE